MGRQRCFRPSWLYLTLQHWCLTLTPGDFPSKYPFIFTRFMTHHFHGKKCNFWFMNSFSIVTSIYYLLSLFSLGTIHKSRKKRRQFFVFLTPVLSFVSLLFVGKFQNRRRLFMSGWCHSSNVEIVVECQIFVIVIFSTAVELYNLGHIQGTRYKRALTQKISFLVICTTFRPGFYVGWKNQNKHSTLNLSFDTLSKWHEPDVRNQRPLLNRCLDV